uniref:Uncharacterized protein n=1 Tax=Arion vulgaris TaxID=1028688 RepID=A0A0B6ZZ29_9EUPU
MRSSSSSTIHMSPYPQTREDRMMYPLFQCLSNDNSDCTIFVSSSCAVTTV